MLATMRLFEDLAVSMGVLLAVNGDTLLPRPHVLEESLVIGVVTVQLLELVALPIRSNVEDTNVVLSTDDESTLDDRVVVFAVDGGSTEEVLARTLKTSVESTNQVVGHEGEGELLIVFVVNSPDRVLVGGNLLPEVLQCLTSVIVGVITLELIERESSTRQQVARVLGLGSGSRLLLLSSSSRRGSLGRLGSIVLLGGNVSELWCVKQLELLGNSRVDGLVDNSLVPTGGGRVLGAPLLAIEVLETTSNDTSGEKVGKGDTFANEVGVEGQVLLKNGNNLLGTLIGIIDSLLVVRSPADKRSVPVGELGVQLLVEERQPLDNQSVAIHLISIWCNRIAGREYQNLLLLSLAEEGGLLVLGGDCKFVSVSRSHPAIRQ